MNCRQCVRCKFNNKGVSYALDCIRNSTDLVAARNGQFLYAGWIHPHLAGPCRCHIVDKCDSGQKSAVVNVVRNSTAKPSLIRDPLMKPVSITSRKAGPRVLEDLRV